MAPIKVFWFALLGVLCVLCVLVLYSFVGCATSGKPCKWECEAGQIPPDCNWVCNPKECEDLPCD